MNRKQTIGGTILSYMLIVLNALYGIVLMPYIIGQIGVAEYGVYKSVSSFASALMVLDLGMGSTAIRYIAQFRVTGQSEKIASCLKMLLMQAAGLAVVAVIFSGMIYGHLDAIYQNGLTPNEIVRAKQLFSVLSVSVVFHLFENVLNGVIAGFNRFLFANGIKLVRIWLRVVGTFCMLKIFRNANVLVIIDALLILLLIALETWYVRVKIGIRMRRVRCGAGLFFDTFRYTITVFIGAIVSQISSNLDNVVIGAIRGAIEVAIYSIALQLYNMFLQLGSALSSNLLPTVVETLKQDDEYMTSTKRLVEKVGRVQFMLVGAAFAGFVVLGKQFVELLMRSPDYADAYYLTLILMGPAVFELCINLCLAVLRARKMLGYYTKMLLFSAGMNLVITVVGTYLFGYYAAAIGTAVSVLVCNVFLMNLYYRQEFGFHAVGIYKTIFERSWLCISSGALAAWWISRLMSGWLGFVCATMCFIVVYAIMLYCYGFSEEERDAVRMMAVKIWRR